MVNVKTVFYPSARIRFWLMIAVWGLLFQGCAHVPLSEINVSRITKEEVKPMLGSPEVIILDVRTAQDWKDAPWKIKGAIWADRNEETVAWINKYPKNKTFVLY